MKVLVISFALFATALGAARSNRHITRTGRSAIHGAHPYGS